MAPSLLCRYFTAVVAATAFSPLIQAVPYKLTQSYAGPTFFNNFDFITSDPTNGYVLYADQGTAQVQGYAKASADGVHLGVDHTTVLDPNGAGRRAVRIESKRTFTKGLFIGDFRHMPTGCGTWPAFWLYGPDWPYNGEIDILEGVNNQHFNQISAHTSSGCTIAGANSKAVLIQNACHQPVSNSGCYYQTRGAFTYGSEFNRIGGGVYAMQWTEQWISIWYFKRGTVPADIKAERPDPKTWGRPVAMFAGSGCPIAERFNQMRIVVNTDFCGPWGGATFAQQGCGASCKDFVAHNPGAFTNAFWHINSIKVFQPVVPQFDLSSAPDATNGTMPDEGDNGMPTSSPSSEHPTSPIDTGLPNASGVASSDVSSASDVSETSMPTDVATPTSFLLSSTLPAQESVTPLASIVSISAPDAAMGATESPVVGPEPTSLISSTASAKLAVATASAKLAVATILSETSASV